MVLAHIPLPNSFVHFVHGFHMPLFFVISGYLYRGKGGYKSLIKTGKKLIIPYISFSLIGYVLWFIEIKPISVEDIMGPIKSIFWMNSNGMPIAGALWFLTAMLFVNTIAYFIEKYIIHYAIKNVVIVIIFIVGLAETTIFPFRFPWSFGAACVGLGYFYFGVILNSRWNTKLILKARKINPFLYILVMVAVSFSVMRNAALNMRTGQYACIPITVINSLVLIFSLWILSYQIGVILEKKMNYAFVKELLKIGKNSIAYLCCNELVINVVRSILRKIDVDNLFTATFFTFVFLKICEKILLQSPFCFLLGQGRRKKSRDSENRL